MSMFDYKAPGRKYHCDIYDMDIHFMYPSINDGKVLGEEIPKLYKGNHVELACYLYMLSDEQGQQKFADYKDKKSYAKEIKKLEGVKRFNEHLLGVTNFLAGIGKDDDLVSDMEGTLEHAKKKS